MSAVADYLHGNRDRLLAELQELLRIPSISTLPERKEDVRKAASWLQSRLRTAGCTTAEVHETGGHPIVYGEWLEAKGKPTILVYGHYDVQPVDPLHEWKRQPFEPVVEGGKIWARGASDDKGQVILHVNALEAHLKSQGTCPVNVKFLIEGEEEVGSDHLEPYIEKNKQRLAADAVVVSDTAFFAKGVPSICHALRGLAYFQIDIRGTAHDLHSGTFGGSVMNPAFALAHLLAQLKDKKGKVLVPGFYDKVRKLSAKERKAFASLPHSDRKWAKDIGAPELFGEVGFTTLERIWARPTLEINGIWGGFQGEGAKTVIPAEAHAKISTRLVPDQTPKEIVRKLESYVRKIAPKAVKVSVRELHGGEAWLAPTDHPALQAASRAVKRAFGKAPVFQREGGSIPVIATFGRILRIPSVLMGMGLNDDNLHAPNEKMDLDQFLRGNDAAAFLMEELGGGREEASNVTRMPAARAGSRRRKTA